MTKYGICETSVLPVRREFSDRSEMITQILFGETFKIIDEQDNWSFIIIDYDNYEGWIDNKCISYISEDLYDQLISNPSHVTNELSSSIIKGAKEQMILPAGSSIPNYDKSSNLFFINDNQYSLVKNLTEDILDVVNVSTSFLNSPYLWGGKNPFGIDCSGFVQVVYKILGIKLLRDANQQVEMGEAVNFISEIQAGDLAFFDNEDGEITHVGIALNPNEIIHASGKVRIDKLDQQGIFNTELNKYTHKLRLIKRVL